MSLKFVSLLFTIYDFICANFNSLSLSKFASWETHKITAQLVLALVSNVTSFGENITLHFTHSFHKLQKIIEYSNFIQLGLS